MLPQPRNAAPRRAAALTTSPEEPQLCCAVCLLLYSHSAQYQQPQHRWENRGYNPSAPSPPLPPLLAKWWAKPVCIQHTHPVMTGEMRVSHTFAHCGLWVVLFGALTQTRRWTESWDLFALVCDHITALRHLWFLYSSNSHIHIWTAQEEWE